MSSGAGPSRARGQKRRREEEEEEELEAALKLQEEVVRTLLDEELSPEDHAEGMRPMREAGGNYLAAAVQRHIAECCERNKSSFGRLARVNALELDGPSLRRLAAGEAVAGLDKKAARELAGEAGMVLANRRERHLDGVRAALSELLHGRPDDIAALAAGNTSVLDGMQLPPTLASASASQRVAAAKGLVKK